eukprot:4550747-Amphidinium_carterae.1
MQTWSRSLVALQTSRRALLVSMRQSAKSSISLSQSGFNFLQWPHQGAWNFRKTDFPQAPASM